MKTEPGQFYVARYSFPEGGPTLVAAAERFAKDGLKVVSIEDYGQGKPGWLTVLFESPQAVEFTPGEELGAGVILSSVKQADLPPLTAWPGLDTVSDRDLFKLYAAIPYSWDFDSLLGHIASESPFFQLDTKNPQSSARGLIQMIAANRKKYGDDRSSFAAQIPGIVGYFKDASKPDLVGSDFKVAGFSQRSVHKPDSTIIFPAGSPEAKGHKAFLDARGNFTVGSVRRWWEHWATEGYKLTNQKPRVNVAGLASHASMWALGALAAVGVMLIIGKKSR